MAALVQGDKAPDFDLPADGGTRIRLSALKGRPVVVYFYPADGTETCTIEASDFSTAAAEFVSAGIAVIGLSPDDPASHDRFKAKHGLRIRLASDTDHSVAEQYGTWVEKTLFGRTYMGIERATFLIGRDGTIERIWRKVRVKGHVAEVLSAAKRL